MDRYLLVDALSVFNAYYRKGEYGVNDRVGRAINRALGATKADGILVAWDGENAKDSRREILPEYKSQRSEKPEGFEASRDKCLAFLSKYWPCERLSQYEADDVIASVIHQYPPGVDVQYVIYTRDQDLHQLLRPKLVTQLITVYPDPQFVTYDTLLRDKHVCADRWLEYRVLMGDASDNVSGVPGIGPKMARKFLETFPSFEAAYERRDDSLFPRKLMRTFATMYDNGELADIRRVMALQTDCPLTWRRPRTAAEELLELDYGGTDTLPLL